MASNTLTTTAMTSTYRPLKKIVLVSAPVGGVVVVIFFLLVIAMMFRRRSARNRFGRKGSMNVSSPYSHGSINHNPMPSSSNPSTTKNLASVFAGLDKVNCSVGHQTVNSDTNVFHDVFVERNRLESSSTTSIDLNNEWRRNDLTSFTLASCRVTSRHISEGELGMWIYDEIPGTRQQNSDKTTGADDAGGSRKPHNGEITYENVTGRAWTSRAARLRHQTSGPVGDQSLRSSMVRYSSTPLLDSPDCGFASLPPTFPTRKKAAEGHMKHVTFDKGGTPGTSATWGTFDDLRNIENILHESSTTPGADSSAHNKKLDRPRGTMSITTVSGRQQSKSNAVSYISNEKDDEGNGSSLKRKTPWEVDEHRRNIDAYDRTCPPPIFHIVNENNSAAHVAGAGGRRTRGRYALFSQTKSPTFQHSPISKSHDMLAVVAAESPYENTGYRPFPGPADDDAQSI